MENLIEESYSFMDELEVLINDVFKDAKYKALVVANEDGFPIASRLNVNEPDLEILISALFNTIITTGLQISDKLVMGTPENMVLSLKQGVIIVNVVQGQACCGLILDNSVNIPFYRFKLDEFSKKLAKILYS